MPDQNKPLRPLLPAPKASQVVPSRPPPPSSRRRPASTKVACNTCRSKKKACDGKRPACASCVELNSPCVYISVNEKETTAMVLKRENQSYKAFLTHLKSMPAEDAIQALKGFQFATDPNAGVRAIRPSGPNDPREFMPHLHSDVEFELMRRHPVAYPLVRKVSQLNLPDDTNFRPSKMARITDVSDSPSSSPEPTITFDNLIMTAPSPEFTDDSMSSRSINSSVFDLPSAPSMPPIRTDPRLKDFDISFWTAVPIPTEVAANAISLYLETDHAILGLFDPDLFIHDLTYYQTRYCSPLLVSAMLSFACQAYAALHPQASAWSQALQEEADKLWRVDKEEADSLTSVTALAFMVQSVGCNGNGELDVQYIQDTAAMARRLKLFGCPDAYTVMDLSRLPEDEARATAQAAWGVFSTLSMVSQFYLPATTEYPPVLPIPGRDNIVDHESATEGPDSSHTSSTAGSPDSGSVPGLGKKRGRSTSTTPSEIFAAFCQLWVLSSKVTWFYQHETGPGRSSPAFALAKYNKLLAWAANLPESMNRSEHSHSHVLICHMWFHGTVLYLFRPFIPTEKQHGIKSWSPSAPAIPAIFAASLEQLKELVEDYMSRPLPNSIFWHTALMHVANAATNDTSDPAWRYYFLKCIYAYLGLYRSFTVAGVIARGLLAMAVRKGAIGTREGYALLQELRAKKSQKLLDKATGLFVTDLDLAVTDREGARVDRLIKKFEELTVLEEYTIGVT